MAEIHRIVVAALLVGGLGHEHGADVGDVSGVVSVDKQTKKSENYFVKTTSLLTRKISITTSKFS